jgi:hypothetical protein
MKKRVFGFVLILMFSLVLVNGVFAEKLGMGIENNFLENGNVDFKITLYDDDLNKINGRVNYVVLNPYSDRIVEGVADSGEMLSFQIPENQYSGTWEIRANYNGASVEENFIIDELKKVNIKLEEDYLVVKNIGNVFYDKKILIMIGDQDQTAIVYLDVGQTKKIRLTAPPGEYTVTVNDGSQKENLVFSNVPLTGNVIGLERVIDGGFWKRYPLVSLFLVVLLLVVLIVVFSKLYHKFSKK